MSSELPPGSESVGRLGHANDDEPTFGRSRIIAQKPWPTTATGFGAEEITPSPGKITLLRTPAGPYVRDDSGVYEGAQISVHYDAMISNRCYRRGLPHEEAVRRLLASSGTQFDPAVVQSFIEIAKEEVEEVFAATGTSPSATI